MTMPVPAKPEVDEKRKAMIAAAQAYDEVQRELTSLRDQLHAAVAGLEAKNSEIDTLRKLTETLRVQFAEGLEKMRTEFTQVVTEERANVEIANKARDQAYAERSDALAWLSSIEAVLERAREGGLQPARRRRNGKHAEVGSGGGGPDSSLVAIEPDGSITRVSGGSVSIPNRGGVGSVSDEGGGHS